jgi:hypothetical protein
VSPTVAVPRAYGVRGLRAGDWSARPAGLSTSHHYRGMVAVGGVAQRGYMTRPLVVLATLVLGAVLAGCSSESNDPASSSGQQPPAVCSSVDALEASVADLGDVQVTENGISAVQDAVSSVESDLGQVTDDATSQYATQVDQLETDFAAVQSAVAAAIDAPSRATLGVVTSSIGALVDDVTGFADDLRSTC